MVLEKDDRNPVTGKLLTKKEREVCLRLSQLDAGLACRRATALLALDEGLTSAEASARASLTIGQIQYLRSAFAQKRLLVFPQDMLLKEKEPAKTKEKTKKDKKVKKKAKKKDDGKKKNKEQKKNKKKNKKDKKAKKNKLRKAESTKK